MLAYLKNLLSKPYSAPVLAFLAALAALVIGYRTTHNGPLSPMEILRQNTRDTSYDPGYWTALAREQPDLYQPALLYCIAHPVRPNCDALRRQAFSTSLERSSTTPPPPLQPAAVPAQPTLSGARPR